MVSFIVAIVNTFLLFVTYPVIGGSLGCLVMYLLFYGTVMHYVVYVQSFIIGGFVGLYYFFKVDHGDLTAVDMSEWD